MKRILINLIWTFIICMHSIVSLSQNAPGIPKELYDAIVKDESPEQVRRVLEAGVDVNSVDEYNRTPLYIASYLHLSEIVKILIEFGANVDLPDITNTTPLNIACYGDMFSSDKMRLNTVKELLKNNADINIREDDGSTALIRASANGQDSIVYLLIENGADINATSDKGETALGYANRFKYEYIIELIKKNSKEHLIITKNGNVRKGPGTQYETIGKVTDGQEYMKINETEDWSKIKLEDGTHGWINKIIIKEVIDISDAVPALPEGFSPVSDIMAELNLVASGTSCLIENSDTPSTWVLTLLSNADVLEFSNSQKGIGQLTGSKFYFDSEGGYDVLFGSEIDENGNQIRPMGKNLIMYTCQNGAKYVLGENKSEGEYGPILINHLRRFIGIGSSVRFPGDNWIKFGDKQYRSGGFTITGAAIKFMSGTEVKTTNEIFKLDFNKWVNLEIIKQ